MPQGKNRKGFLIYHPQEAAKNRGFIQGFQERGASLGIDFVYVPVSEYQKYQGDRLPALALNRTRKPEVSRWYQERGVPVFHESPLVELANDKYKSIQYFGQRLPGDIRKEKWCPESWLVPAEEMEKIFLGEQSLPGHMVIKSLDGHGGTEVFVTEDLRDLAGKGERDDDPGTGRGVAVLRGRDCLLQERIVSDSQDLRVYVMGGEIYQAVLRTGRGDFRSNFSLGGSVRSYTLSARQEQWIRQFIRVLPGNPAGMLGLDFIVGRDGRLVFNEIEEMAGCRMLYRCTGRDIIGDYAACLQRFLLYGKSGFFHGSMV